jgi:hypothetical protein
LIYAKNGGRDKEYRVEICLDNDPVNPRTEYDHITKLFLNGSLRWIGDEYEGRTPKSVHKDALAAGDWTHSVYAHVHSLTTLSLHPFNDPFDSGCAGIITIPKDRLERVMEYHNNADCMDVAMRIARDEIASTNDYLHGNVYGFKAYLWGDMQDSCWGFIGDFDEIAQVMADHVAPEYKELFKGAKYGEVDSMPVYGAEAMVSFV